MCSCKSARFNQNSFLLLWCLQIRGGKGRLTLHSDGLLLGWEITESFNNLYFEMSAIIKSISVRDRFSSPITTVGPLVSSMLLQSKHQRDFKRLNAMLAVTMTSLMPWGVETAAPPLKKMFTSLFHMYFVYMKWHLPVSSWICLTLYNLPVTQDFSLRNLVGVPSSALMLIRPDLF